MRYDGVMMYCFLLIFFFVIFTEHASASPSEGFYNVYAEASKNNSDIRGLRHEFDIAKEAVPQALSTLLPSINSETSLTRTSTLSDQNTFESRRAGSVYKITLSQPIFSAERFYRLAGAKLSLHQAQIKLASDEQELIFNSAAVYIKVLQAQADLYALKNELIALQRQFDQVTKRYKIGIATQIELYQAKAAVDGVAAQRVSAQRKLQDAAGALESFTHGAYNHARCLSNRLPILSPEPVDEAPWVERAQAYNLRLLAAQQEVAAAGEAVNESKSGHLLSVDLVGQYSKGDNDSFGYTNQTGSAPYGRSISQSSIAIQVSLPLFNGGSVSSKVRESIGRLAVSEDRLDSVKWQTLNDARLYFRAVASGALQISILRDSLASNRSAVHATQVGYDIGTGSLVDLLNAQRQFYEAVRNYDAARHDYILDTLHLKQTVGILAPSDLLALDAYVADGETDDGISTQINP